MKFYQIVFYTLSTVSIIYCSQQPNQNENNSAVYHIEFEDKSINGGYGYKLQVAGKTKYQESWKNNKKATLVDTSTPVKKSDYSSDYTTSINNFQHKTDSLNKVESNNIAQNSFLDSSVKLSNVNNAFESRNQFLSKPVIDSSSQNVVPSNNHQEKIQAQLSEKNQYLGKKFLYSSINSYNTPDDSQVSLNSQSGYITPNYESENNNAQFNLKSGFVPSVYYSTIKPSLEIMNSNQFYDSANNGPQIFVESTSGKISHNQYLNGFQSNSNNIVSSPGIDIPNQYLKTKNNYQYYSQNSAAAQNEQYPGQYQQQQLQYEPVTYSNLYNTQVPSVTPSYSYNNQNSHSNNNYNSIKYSAQYASPSYSDQGISAGISYPKDNIGNKSPNSSSGFPSHVSTPTVSLNQFVSEPQIKYYTDNSLPAYVSVSNNYKPDYNSALLNQYYQNNNLDNLHKPTITGNQYTTQTPTQYYAIVNQPSLTSNGDASDIPSINLEQYNDLKTVKSTQQQNIPVISSAQIPINYNQLYQQDNSFNPQVNNDNTQLKIYNTENQPINEKVVNYRYEQEFPVSGKPTNVPTYNSLQNINNIMNSYPTNSLGNIYGTILNSNIHQSGSQNIGNNLYSIFANGNISPYSHGLNYGYNSPEVNVLDLTKSNGYVNTGSTDYNGNLQFVNKYNTVKRSLDKVKNNHRFAVDKKTIE